VSERTEADFCHDTTFMYYIRSPTTKIAYGRRLPDRPAGRNGGRH